ncbi:LEA type 2 family protein [Psychromonas sp. L1A2]|uniref:LEA type 2 family protein n=1 Tax=Psychromonas sp. L1A2 TaxID=2686356 RepID=UPI00135980E8|nr:LEA type 2 family protein [Psychromonas sp. L1A2]
MFKKLIIVTTITMLSACSVIKDYVKQPDVNYKSFAIGEVSMDRIELNPTFNIVNGNAFSLPINSVTYELSLNDEKMLDGETDAIGTLPANGNKDVSLSLALTKETLTSLQQLLFKERKLDYQIKGNVNSLGLAIPFERSATIYIPEVSIADLKVVNASFSELDIILSVDVDNQNDFNLPLDDVNYSVSSKGSELFKGALSSQKITKGKSNLQLPLTIKPSDMFSNVFSLLLSPELPLHFEITSPLFTKSYDQTINLSSFIR